MSSKAEQETVVVAHEVDDLVRIWSNVRRHITKMRRSPAFTEVRTGVSGTSEFAEFTIPADRWSPLGVKRSVSLTKQQRSEAAARLLAARQAP